MCVCLCMCVCVCWLWMLFFIGVHAGWCGSLCLSMSSRMWFMSALTVTFTVGNMSVWANYSLLKMLSFLHIGISPIFMLCIHVYTSFIWLHVLKRWLLQKLYCHWLFSYMSCQKKSHFEGILTSHTWIGCLCVRVCVCVCVSYVISCSAFVWNSLRNLQKVQSKLFQYTPCVQSTTRIFYRKVFQSLKHDHLFIMETNRVSWS